MNVFFASNFSGLSPLKNAQRTEICTTGISRRKLLGGAMASASLYALPSVATTDQLTEVASTDKSWVQVAIAPNGRIFVNYSRWFGRLDMAVAEVGTTNGPLLPYPNARFSSSDAALPASCRAVSVQSVVLDPRGQRLWIVDSGNPQLSGIKPGGPN
jgi:hypothetical protein